MLLIAYAAQPCRPGTANTIKSYQAWGILCLACGSTASCFSKFVMNSG